MSKRDFFADVYDVVRLVPFGRVTTYGAIAQYLGAKGSARMVGWALNQAHAYPDVPAQRVVNRAGLLTGKHHFRTPTEMAERLATEGIRVENDRVLNFDALFWHPSEHLD